MANLSTYYPLPIVAGTTAGTFADGASAAHVGLANTFSQNQTLNGTNNVAPNQTAASGSSLMTRALADQRLLDSLWSGRLTRYTLTGWRTAVTGGGFLRTWPDAQSGLFLRCGSAGGSIVATASGSSINHIFPARPGLSSDTRYMNYSERFRVFVKFAETLSLTANCFYYLRFDQAAGGTPAIGDPTAKSVGFKVTHLSGFTGQLFGVVHDGTNLSISASSFVNIPNRNPIALVIDSLGNGTVNYYVNGTLVGTMTGGPTGNTASGAHSPHFGVSSGGDATDTTLQVADLQVMVGDF